MAATTLQMTANKQFTLQEIHQAIHYIEGAEMVSQVLQTIHDVTILSLVYEKFYFRTSSYASISVVLTEYGNEQTACIAASGGGTGISNITWGANGSFAKSCVQALKSCGFTVVGDDAKSGNQSWSERLFK